MNFLLLAVTNYHTFSTSHDINLVSYHSGGQKSEMGFRRLRSRCGQDCNPSGGCRGDSVSVFSSL